MKNHATNPTTLSVPNKTPQCFDLEKHILPDGTTEYRHPWAHHKVNVKTQSLSFMMKASIERFKVMLDILSDDEYEKFGAPFMAMIRDSSSTIDEAIHCIEKSVGEIQVSVIERHQFPYKAGAVVNAKLVVNKGEACQ
ncbi:hypothetical protein SAMN02746065_10911 [Desulfocicer vacuolatum DSM 3385]|uniref:Uncharacterized protein n=1 Tax=Desulfocicer vacuolatum DSM 3385 TaxID=1121400 RepID=A0A1W2BNM0_9BACT|nr:hypothetical protein [Desulfocicer vacuolatum]SMC74539.1 hypothetical protein SAMN02746065_10911 [Desulfocicer vacuolatum DSM 3385]